MTPLLRAASIGMQDTVQYLCVEWKDTWLPFHTYNGGRNVLQLTYNAGGANLNGYKWLLAYVRSPEKSKLEMTHGTGREYADKTTGALTKAWTQRLTYGQNGKGKNGKGGKEGKRRQEQAASSNDSGIWSGGGCGGNAWWGGSTTTTPAAPGTGMRRRQTIGKAAEAIRLLRHFSRAGLIG